MACGTPVVAWRCGSTSEVIEPGVTGFLVDSDEEADQAVLQARQLDRAAVRRRFELRYSASAMARRYVDLYEQLGAPGDIDAPDANQLDPTLACTA
jgi:glycosyltransferase involved in cell wall biosynthesis